MLPLEVGWTLGKVTQLRIRWATLIQAAAAQHMPEATMAWLRAVHQDLCALEERLLKRADLEPR